MRFAHLSLTNYIGIYNGMGITNINIDFTKCRYRTTVIKGDNGSGKSTIMKALDLFPDSNDCFIPGQVAKKEIVLQDFDVQYRLTFVHGIKQNGDRDTSKAYIARIEPNGTIRELNENGNINSYKAVLYDELTLDPNFSALSQLSLEDRGLADKRPAERKRFVNSIIESLEVYNDMYKTLSKKSSNYKNLINGIIAKLGLLGDPKVLEGNLKAIEDRCNIKMDEKDKTLVELAEQNSIISILDPDGSIQIHYKEITEQRSQVILRRSKLYNLLQSEATALFDPDSVNDQYIADISNKINIANNRLTDMRQVLEGHIQNREEESRYLLAKSQRLRSLTSTANYDTLVYQYSNYMTRIQQIEEEIKVTGIPLGSITKNEYIIALKTLKDICNAVDALKDAIEYHILEEVIEDILSSSIDPGVGYSFRSIVDTDLLDSLSTVEREIIVISQSMSMLDKLVNRPDKCNIDNCFFISDAVEFSKTNPKARIEELEEEKRRIEGIIRENDENKIIYSAKQEAVRYIYQIIQLINRNADLLKKVGINKTSKDILSDIMNNQSFDYMMQIYQYIDLANLFDEYTNLFDLANSLKHEIDLLETRKDMIDELVEEINQLQSKVNAISQTIDDYNIRIHIIETQIFDMEVIRDYNVKQNRILSEIRKLDEMIAGYDRELSSIEDKTKRITDAISRIAELKARIQQITNELTPLMSERDKLNHKIQLVHDYSMELESLNGEYALIEKLKYYTSPTSGIQLVFMELYMGKVIGLANELLSFLFSGSYQIQPFIINDSEFRIPCLGEGYLNDDISSMSSAQIAMISMILSFSLLHQSSTKYNIIKLDEIDGPLDETNRIMFVDVLNKIMDIMRTEHCIMISHNSELQMETCDIILLKSSTGISDYTSGNIIWKYQ